MTKRILVGIIMGSDSDLSVMQEAAIILETLQVPHEVTIVSAHRTPTRMMTYAQQAEERGLGVIIAGAGGAAHLPGMVAAVTPLPVIGVPIQTHNAALQGLDALLAIVQMPGGVPVATVAINNAKNAGLLAASILSNSDAALRQRLKHYKNGLATMVAEKAAKLEQVGWKHYSK